MSHSYSNSFSEQKEVVLSSANLLLLPKHWGQRLQHQAALQLIVCL